MVFYAQGQIFIIFLHCTLNCFRIFENWVVTKILYVRERM